MDRDLSDRLAALPPHRLRELVRKLSKGDRGTPHRMPRNPEGRYPLSSAQERMWFLAQLSPTSNVLNNPGALRARTRVPLDLDLLGRSVAHVVRRHEILRTTFHSEGGRPYQRVHDDLPPAYAWTDLSPLDLEDREAEVLRIAAEEGRRPFDLTTGPLFAFRVLRLDPLEYVLLITTHHIISDGWTNAMLAPEIAAAYGSLLQGDTPPPPREDTPQYVDFVQWERDWLEGDQAARQLDYWRARLADDPPMDLPTDRRRPARMSYVGGLATHRFDAEFTERLRELARAEKVSLFHLLNAAFLALLHRYSGAEVVTVGTQTANRNHREFQRVMGLFANTVVLRTPVEGTTPFRSHLQAVRRTCTEALQNQEYPFERLIEEVKPRRTLDRHPVFQVMHVHQNVPSLYRAPEMDIEVLKVDYGTAKFDLNLWSEEIGDGITLTLHFDRALFDAVTARRWLEHYQTILEGALADPGTALEDLPLAPTAPPPHVDDPEDIPSGPFHEAFEAQVRKTPDAPAVEAKDGTLTYRELNARSNRLAHRLVALGVAGQEAIGVMLDRTTDAIVAILGIWKAGGAYVPIDPTTPPARLATMLATCRARLLVTSSTTRLPEALDHPLTLVTLDGADDSLAGLPEDDLQPHKGDGNTLAYIVFTSGTTGEPKGVCVEHRSLLAYCRGVSLRMSLRPGARYANVTSLAADLGHTMIFPPLLEGGCVVLVAEELVTDAAGLAQHFREHPVDCLKTVPSHMDALLSSRGTDTPIPRSLVVLGGEECTQDLVARIRSLAPGLRIMNHYGPSEATVGVLTYEVPSPGPSEESRIPLGSPLPGSRVEILDDQLRRVPIGVPGEIYLAGSGLARGYLGDTSLTRERFVDDPYEPGERLYRTGDRGMWGSESHVVFLGRRDRQVKVRGFRLELDEVERALSACPGVAVAAVPQPEPGAETFVAYVQPIPDQAVSEVEIKRFVSSRLPAYSVPSRVFVVNAIPLTRNGKVDYRSLSELEAPAHETASPPPRDTVELELAELWRTHLGVARVGIDDDFFQLGGHSLLAVRVMAAIHQRFGCRLPLHVLFEHGTVRRLAELIRRSGQAPPPSPLVKIRAGDGTPMVFVHPAGGHVLCYQELARATGEARPFWAMQATHEEEGPRSIVEMAERYLEVLFAVPHAGTPVFGGWSMGALVAVEMARGYGREKGDWPTVVILDQPAPGGQTDGGAPNRTESDRLGIFARKVGELVGDDLGLDEDVLATSTDQERAGLFLERFKAHQLAPESTRIEDFKGFLDLMLLHNTMTVEYEPEPYPGRLVVLHAQGEESRRSARPPDLGWGSLAAGLLDVLTVPGTHVTMMRSPHVSVVAERILEGLGDRAPA